MRIDYPAKESEVMALFKATCGFHGWRIVHQQVAFPDAIIENRDGIRLTIEFEYWARNFKWHDHDPVGCDLVVCWKNDWPDCPLPVWEIGATDGFQDIADFIQDKCTPLLQELDAARRESNEARKTIQQCHDHIRQLQAEKFDLEVDLFLAELPSATIDDLRVGAILASVTDGHLHLARIAWAALNRRVAESRTSDHSVQDSQSAVGILLDTFGQE